MKYLQSIAAVLVLMVAATDGAWADRGHFGGRPGHFQGQPGHFHGHRGHFHGHHHHFRSHVFLGIGVGSYWGPWSHYPPAVVYSAPPVYVERPPVYVEQSPAPSANNYWYYCADSRSYFPYVTECRGGWQQVVPTPPNSR